MFENITGGDQDITYVLCLGKCCRIHNVFIKGDRLGIGVGYRRDAVADKTFNQQVRWQVVIGDILRAGLGYLPVLAVQAAEIAAGCGNGQNRLTGHEVIERFFLHGVKVNRTGVDIRNSMELVGVDDPRPAEASVIFSQDALMGTETALHQTAALLIP